jgi:hypothetical protein
MTKPGVIVRDMLVGDQLVLYVQDPVVLPDHEEDWYRDQVTEAWLNAAGW